MSEAISSLNTPRPRKPPGPTRARPNYIFLLIGIALILFETLAGSRLSLPAASDAALIALGVTLALYGVYPVNVMTGSFKGIFGRLAVAGPAAMGLAVFIFIFQALNSPTPPGILNDLILLLATSDPALNTAKVGNADIRLLDVDSFDDEKVLPILQRLTKTLEAAGVPEGQRKDEVQRLAAMMLTSLRIGKHTSRAREIVRAYPDGETGVMDSQWKELMKSVAEDRDAIGRVKRQPFAIVVTSDAVPPVQLLTERSSLHVGDDQFEVAVIANPTRRYTPGLEEAIVLKRRAPSQGQAQVRR